MMMEFFLENQQELDALYPPPPPPPPPSPECKHDWERVLIDQTLIPAFSCRRCGAEKLAQRMDPEDFAGKGYNHFSRRRPPREPQPQCTSITIRDRQCSYPCRPGEDRCTRHLNRPQRPPRPLCSAKTRKGIKCKHPCISGESRCGRHQTLRGVRLNA